LVVGFGVVGFGVVGFGVVALVVVALGVVAGVVGLAHLGSLAVAGEQENFVASSTGGKYVGA
jgi:hypothetical protein